MIKQLNSLCGEYGVCIYTNREDTQRFHYGCILSVNENEIAIYEISPDGKYDGIIALETDRVFRVDVDSLYRDKMKKLCSDFEYSKFDCEFDTNHIFASLLRIAKEKNEVVSIELLDSGIDDIMGFVEDIDNACLKIKVIDSYGYEEGCSYIKLNDITQICLSSDVEKRIKLLWKLRDK